MTRQRPAHHGAGITRCPVALVILLFPLYAVIIGSLENNSQLLGTHYNFLPPTPSFANYSTVFHFQGGHILSTLIIGVFTALADPGHLGARRARAGPVPVPGHGVRGRRHADRADPARDRHRRLAVPHLPQAGLLNSYPGLVIADASYGVPFSILVLRAFMLGLPNDVLQATRVDGATEWSLPSVSCCR